MTTIMRHHPFCTWFVVAGCLRSILWVWNPAYDGNDLGALVLLTSAIWGFPIWLPHELLFSLNEGRGFPMQTPLAFGIGGVACLVCDWLLSRIVVLARQDADSTDD